MDSLTGENRLVFMKIDKAGLVWFCWFTKNRPVEFEIFKNLRNFEIKNPKKTSDYLKDFGQNRIQKFIVFRPEKFKEVLTGL
jgi:hypothetical protein